jgi:acetate kinase
MTEQVLIINGGSSSIKFAVYEAGAQIQALLRGNVERIGLPQSSLKWVRDLKQERRAISAEKHEAAIGAVIELLSSQSGINRPAAIGHRIVHGGARYSASVRVTSEVLDELRRMSPLDPEHLPSEIALIEALGRHYRDVPQVACFDTAFGRQMPRVARIIPIPRKYEAQGVQRYGFHGLSYTYLMEEIARLDGPRAAQGRIILAHLGNGASMAAVRDGRCIDTSMGLTPVSGLVMSTRSGDVDPGLAGFLHRTQKMSPQEFHEMIHEHSGLLGVSETSPDMRDLLAKRQDDPRAAEAVDLFCYQARKWIGAFAAALSGLDMLVFSGGIGEHSPQIRAEICKGLEFLGIRINAAANEATAQIISEKNTAVLVRVLKTDEEQVIAMETYRLLRGSGK